jgi:hypothetical protein
MGQQQRYGSVAVKQELQALRGQGELIEEDQYIEDNDPDGHNRKGLGGVVVL